MRNGRKWSRRLLPGWAYVVMVIIPLPGAMFDTTINSGGSRTPSGSCSQHWPPALQPKRKPATARRNKTATTERLHSAGSRLAIRPAKLRATYDKSSSPSSRNRSNATTARASPIVTNGSRSSTGPCIPTHRRT